MTSPVAGWYPDPSGQPGERWWNGVSWSDDTRAAPAAAAGPAAPAAAGQAWDGFGNPATPPAAGPPPTSAAPAFATGQYGGRPPSAAPSWVARNGFSLGTIGVAVGYLLILVFVGVGILGILPLFLSFRAVSRKEPLAWVAVAVGVVALVLGIYAIAR